MASDHDFNHHRNRLARICSLIFLHTIELGFLIDVHFTVLLVPNWSAERPHESLQQETRKNETQVDSSIIEGLRRIPRPRLRPTNQRTNEPTNEGLAQIESWPWPDPKE